MGCLLSLLSKKPTGTECLRQIKEVDDLLQEMLNKYQRQHDDIQKDIVQSLREKQKKDILIHKLRRKKVILYHMDVCRKKIEILMQKQYALEQLNITKMQINAIKNTVKVFKIFNKRHSLEKIEDLQDTLEELSSQFLDVESCLAEASPLIQIDESELEEELDMLESQPLDFPTVPTTGIEIPDSQTKALLTPAA